MHLITRNVNTAFNELVSLFNNDDYAVNGENSVGVIKRPSRNGPVLMIDEPVMVTYTHPKERVLFNHARDANPFLHLYEALWMLAGRNDVAPLAYYAKQFEQYSDDGKTLNGAYGYRWRHAFNLRTYDSRQGECKPLDQLRILIDHLKTDPNSRRAVLQMWNVESDLLKIDTSKDVCCNTAVYFSIRDTDEYDQAKDARPPQYVLDMTVTNRSNDLCLAGETRFRSPEGDKSIQELAKKFQNEKRFKYPIYAIDTVTGDQRLSWMTNAWKTGTKPVLKIGFDDGSFIRLTGDHILFKKTKLFEGKRCTGLKIEERQACEFKIGDRVLADVPEFSSARAGSYIKFKRNLFQNTGFSNMVNEHREYWEFMTGEKLGTDDVHHDDENGRNNTYSNLSKMSRSAHMVHHMTKSNPNFKMTPQQVFDRASKGGKTHKGKNVSEETRKKLSIAAKLRDKSGKRKRNENGHYISNHKIISIEQDGLAIVYDFTVPGRHNAVLNNGVVAHNCWGMLGANVVHFSFLQEYMAAQIGVEVGRYTQMTNNLHVYENNWKPDIWLAESNKWSSKSYDGFNKVNQGWLVPLIKNPAKFDEELPKFIETYSGENPDRKTWVDYSEPFIKNTAVPMMDAFYAHKRRQYNTAEDYCSQIVSDDWRIAVTNWITKRRNKHEGK
jgi:thymidylate synthase